MLYISVRVMSLSANTSAPSPYYLGSVSKLAVTAIELPQRLAELRKLAERFGTHVI